MINWILAGRYRIHGLLLGYFVVHVLVRTLVSSSLSFDESEQAFLSQWVQWGYNSQPPLYTWLQLALFKTFGYSVLPIAMLKNILLLLTYYLVFAFVCRATGDRILAVVASIGMLTIPQVAWESHRDLSHTVLVTLATAVLLYCVIEVVRKRSTFWYVLLGISCGFGMLAKYNFAITIVCVAVAAFSIPEYRKRLLDARLLFSMLIAAAIIAPHAIWAVGHVDLATSKTISQLTSSVPTTWAECIWQGMVDLITSTLACSIATVVVFVFCFRETIATYFARTDCGNQDALDGNRQQHLQTLWLVERFLLSVGVALLVIVLSGYAITIKNHWLHPFLFLLPAYLALKFNQCQVSDRRQVNRLCFICLLCAISTVVASIGKPVTAGMRAHYSWLNVPYKGLAAQFNSQHENSPSAVFALDMRTGGNLRLQFSSSPVLTLDNPHLVNEFDVAQFGRLDGPVIVVIDSLHRDAQQQLVRFAVDRLNRPAASVRWQTFRLPYRFGLAGDTKEFDVAVIDQQPTLSDSVHIDADRLRR